MRKSYALVPAALLVLAALFITSSDAQETTYLSEVATSCSGSSSLVAPTSCGGSVRAVRPLARIADRVRNRRFTPLRTFRSNRLSRVSQRRAACSGSMSSASCSGSLATTSCGG